MTTPVDTGGTAQERYAYTPYGAPTYLTASFGARGSSSYAWDTLYCGYRHESATGLYTSGIERCSPCWKYGCNGIH